MARALAAAIVLVGVLTACGSASPRGFHSATETYSVHAVEIAFSQHGLPLVKAQSQPLPGVTALTHGNVSVQVATNGGTLYGLVGGENPPHRTRHGNVYVFFPAANSGAVHLALAELH